MDEAKRDASVVAFRIAGAGAPPSRGVIIDTGRLGGPSAGLAFALAIVDVLTPGELTGLRTVAATGAVTADGAVEAVGGVRLKTIAARKAHADLILVPKANYREAVANAGHMRVVPVDTVAGAIAALVGR